MRGHFSAQRDAELTDSRQELNEHVRLSRFRLSQLSLRALVSLMASDDTFLARRMEVCCMLAEILAPVMSITIVCN